MILNLRVDHKLADIQSMEIISKDIDELFAKLQEKYSIVEYIEISTCNRKEYFIHNKHIPEDEEIVSVICVGYRAINPQMPKRKTVEEIAKFY